MPVGNFLNKAVYFQGRRATFYPYASAGSTVFANEWERVALTYDGTTLNLYSGDPSGMNLAVTNGSSAAYFTLANTLQFLVDDAATGRSENYPVQISSLWLFDDPLSAVSIQNLSGLPVSAIPEPSATAMLAMIAVFGLARRRHRKG